MSGRTEFAFSPVEVAIYWGRLRAAADESALTLARTAVAGIIRHMLDLACVFFNRDRQVVVQDSLGDPGLRGAMPNAVNFILGSIPQDDLGPGDVVLTNDPWGGTGHLLDLCVLMPIYSSNILIGYAATVAHHADIGGVTDSSALDVYEEGFWIPPVKYHRAGQVDKVIQQIIARNVRVPDQVIPDIRAQIAAANLLARRVEAMARELGEERFVAITHEILDRTETATRTKLAGLPAGTFGAELVTDRWADRMGNETERLRIKVAVSISPDIMVIDYAGTSLQVPVGINSTLGGMTMGYTLTALKSVVDPAMPLNHGFLRCFEITAPAGSLLNPRPPAPCLSRSQIGFLLPEVVYKALAPIMPDRVIAACGGVPPWSTRFVGKRQGRGYAENYSPRGGFGAGYGRDGVSCMAFPGNVRNLPIETLEEQVPLVCECKEFRVDSAGLGQWRGGWGQEIHLRVLADPNNGPEGSITVNLRGGGRREYRVEGILGGLPGAPSAFLLNGEPVRSGKTISLFPGDRLSFLVEGGGGYGSPEMRQLQAILDDIDSGLLSPETARAVFPQMTNRPPA